jgi:hypothetical protein
MENTSRNSPDFSYFERTIKRGFSTLGHIRKLMDNLLRQENMGLHLLYFIGNPSCISYL